MQKRSLAIGVLMGGPSSEHAISLKSGHGIFEALARRGWIVHEIVIPQALTVGEARTFTRRELALHRIDVAFVALHGPFGEDGTIQQLCEELPVLYTGCGPQASRLGLDKVASRERFERAGVPVPRWRLIDPSRPADVTAALAALRLPVVVKPTNQGSSIGVSIVERKADIANAIEEAARYDARVLVEEFVRGREVTVGILAEQPLPVIEIKPSRQFFDFSAKYTSGLTDYLVPAPLKEDVARGIQAVGLAAHQALGCRHFSRVDLILRDSGEPVVLEVNTIPGFTATSLLPKAAACAGISYDELCERIIAMAVAVVPSARSATAGAMK